MTNKKKKESSPQFLNLEAATLNILANTLFILFFMHKSGHCLFSIYSDKQFFVYCLNIILFKLLLQYSCDTMLY